MLRRIEQVATRAARARKVSGPILVAGETCVPRQARLVSVSGVAAQTRLVLGNLVEAAEAWDLVTGRADGRRSDAFRAVRSMTIGATTRHPPVFRARFGGVASGACGRRSGGTGMRRVTAHAVGMASWRATRLRLVAALTGGRLIAAMRFVTTGALGVPADHRLLFRCMARHTGAER